MTPQLFKDLFNLLYNNINNNAAPGLSDAEISSFLNKALNEIIKQHVLGPATVYLLGINQTSKRDVELNNLIKTTNYLEYTPPLQDPITSVHGKGVLFNTPSKNFLIVLSEVLLVTFWDSVENEEDNSSTLVSNTIPYNVTELSYALFNKFISGVYKYPKKGLCWKLRHDEKIELVYPSELYNKLENNNNTVTYKIVYVEMPQQFNLPNTGCALPEVLHDEIVQRAVELAKAAYASQDTNIQLSMGQRSE